MEMRIGLQQAVTMDVFERALTAVLDGSYSLQYAEELAWQSTSGEARVKKIRTVIHRLSANNPLLPFIKEHKEEILLALRNKNDRSLLYVALTCAAFPFAYNVVSILGKYFHAQDEITNGLLKAKICDIYGSVRTVEIALFAITPMLMDSGFIVRTQPGTYIISKQTKYTDFALLMYKKAFLLNNPNFTENDDVESNPYFEFIN